MERLHPWSGERESRFERSREGGGIGTWEHGRSDLEVKPQREMKRVPAHGVLWHGCGVAPPLARGADARSARRGDTGSSACRRRLRENHPRAGCELCRPPCAIGSPRARRPRRDRLLGSDAQDEGPGGGRWSSPTACGDPRRAPSPTRAGAKRGAQDLEGERDSSPAGGGFRWGRHRCSSTTALTDRVSLAMHWLWRDDTTSPEVDRDESAKVQSEKPAASFPCAWIRVPRTLSLA